TWCSSAPAMPAAAISPAVMRIMAGAWRRRRSALSPLCAVMSAWSAVSTPTAIRLSCPATIIARLQNRFIRADASPPMSCRATDGAEFPTTPQVKRPASSAGRFVYVVVNSDLATRDDLGIDAAIGMAEIVHQGARDRNVANPGIGVDLGGRAALDALDHFEPRIIADGD